MSRRTARKAKGKGQIVPSPRSLSTLPRAVLLKIFTEVTSEKSQDGFKCLFLSTKLFPVALEAYYFKFDIFSVEQCLQLYTRVRRRPEIGNYVDSVFISAGSEGPGWMIPQRGITAKPLVHKTVKRKEGAKAKKKELEKATRVDKLSPPSEFGSHVDPSWFNFGDDLLQDLFANRLSKLTRLGFMGKTFLNTLLSDDNINNDVFPSLKTLVISLPNYEDFCCDKDKQLCSRLSKLSKVVSITFSGKLQRMPWDENPVSSSVALAPNSWKLKEFSMKSLPRIGYLPPLFTSFTHSLRSLDLSTSTYYASLVDDLQLLPPTLRELSITYGDNACMGAVEAYIKVLQTNELPVLDQALLHFPELEQLSLLGPVVSPEFADVLFQLCNLQLLSLGLHVPIDTTRILELIKGPRQLPVLHTLLLNLCHCPPADSKPEEAFSRPRWESKFDRKGAIDCSKAAAARGIKRLGTWQCAVKHCDKSDGHACPRALEPIE